MGNKPFIALLSALSLSSCGWTETSEPTIGVKFENRSSHDIVMEWTQGPPVGYPTLWSLEIPAGERTGYTIEGSEITLYEEVIPSDCTVTFDGEVSRRYVYEGEETPGHHVCAPKAYQLSKKGENHYLTFTFTDADYEEALGSGAPNGNVKTDIPCSTSCFSSCSGSSSW